MGPMSVRWVPLNTSTLEDSSEFVGTLKARDRVSISPRVDGRIVGIYVQEGERVQPGQLLVELQQDREQAAVSAQISNIAIQQAALQNAQAQLGAATAEQAQAAANIEQQRAAVARAQAEVASRTADLRSQEAELRLAETEFERFEYLVQEGAESDQALDERLRNLDAARATLQSLKQLKAAAAQEANAAESALRVSQSALGAAQARVSAAEATVAQNQATLSQAEATKRVSESDLQFTRITAPIAGVIGDIGPKMGDYLEAGDVVTTLTQNAQLDLSLNVPIEQSAELQVGLPVNLLDAQGNILATGSISFVSPNVSPTAQTVLAKASFANNGNLRDEQFVQAQVIWQQQPGVLVPTEAISRIGGQTFVYIAESGEDGSTVARQTLVQLGQIQGQSYQVESGVTAGDRLITSQVLNLSDGMPIAEESLQSQTPPNSAP